MSLKFCANLSFMYKETNDLFEKYRLAHKSGFKAVECASPYEYDLKELVKIKTQLGLEQILINVPNGDLSKGEMGFAALPGKEELFMESFQKALKYAEALNCPRIHITAGVVKDRTPENLLVYEQNLSKAVQMLEKTNIVGLIEPINHYSLPDYFMNDFSTAFQLISKINSPHLRLQMDIFHLQTIQGNLSRSLRQLFPIIGHIQIAQVPDRNEPDTPGEIDYKYLFNLLTQLDYKGWIGLEYFPLSGLNWIKDFGYSL